MNRKLMIIIAGLFLAAAIAMIAVQVMPAAKPEATLGPAHAALSALQPVLTERSNYVLLQACIVEASPDGGSIIVQGSIQRAGDEARVRKLFADVDPKVPVKFDLRVAR